ncbi:MAG TPA: hypothetical protein VM582_04730, partial [Candidatus Thermoplasmatota archaeon]|nr:hypothetical protein [Candidatus Thermoplasmatota archaeon]
MRAALLVCVLLAGCAAPFLAPAEARFDEPGAFPPRPDLPDARPRAASGAACLELSARPDLSAFRPGLVLRVAVTLVNCGDAPLFLEPRCGGHVGAHLARGAHAWRLGPDGEARAACEDAGSARELAPREAAHAEFAWRGFLGGDACGAGRWDAGALPAPPGTYRLVFEARSAQGLQVGASASVAIMDGEHEAASRLAEGGGGFRTLDVRAARDLAEKPTMLLTSQGEWADFCRAVGGERALGWPYLDFAQENALVVRGHCVHGVAHLRAVDITQVYATRCDGRDHVVAIASRGGELRLVDLAERFVLPHEPPTLDPREPYAFDPRLAVHLSRDAEGRLAPAGSPQEPLPPCDASRAPPPGPAADADGDKVWDDLEALLASRPAEARVAAIVGMACPFAWDDVLALRARVGPFPVDAVWSTGAQAFA